jgi:putative salt-induced outer membrane protein
MNTILKLATVSAVALMVASPVLAQSRIVGIEALDDKIDDITDDVQTDLDRANDADRFGPNSVAQGWRGSFALSASAASGNTDTGDLSGAGRLTYGIGSWNHLIGFAVEYGEANGVKNKEKFFATYEGNRYFTDQFYLFGVARYEFDGLSIDGNGNVLDGNETDAFVGFGPGYRVLNAPTHTWRLQAGPGVRYFSDITGNSETEVGFIASSRYYISMTDTISFTMDTDVLGSSENTVLANDAGFNFKVSDNLSTRVSYRVEYNTDPAGGRKSTDNTLGLSLVLGF